MRKFSAFSIVMVALCSHLCFSNYAILATRVSEQFGSYRGGFYLYALSAPIIVAFVLIFAVAKRNTIQVTPARVLLKLWLPLIACLVAYTGSAILYYQVFLTPSGERLTDLQSAEFGFMTRLDSMAMILVGFLLLKEKLSTLNIIGAAIALAAWACVVSLGNLDSRAWLHALGFISCSCVGGSLAKYLLRTTDALTLLSLRTVWIAITLACVTAFAPTNPGKAQASNSGFLVLGITALLLTGGFGLRFLALRHMPLCRYSMISALQPFAALPALHYLQGKTWPAGVILAMLFFAIGECMAFWKSKDLLLE